MGDHTSHEKGALPKAGVYSDFKVNVLEMKLLALLTLLSLHVAAAGMIEVGVSLQTFNKEEGSRELQDNFKHHNNSKNICIHIDL